MPQGRAAGGAVCAFLLLACVLLGGRTGMASGARGLEHAETAAGRAAARKLAQGLPAPPPARRQQRRITRPNMTLLWNDEFDGAELDSSKWEALEGDGTKYTLPPGWGNNELQYYTGRPINARVRNGRLIIQAQAEPVGSPYGRYTSARLRTAGRFAVAPSPDFPTIRVEACIKLAAGEGMWPAFWMLPEDWAYGDWPASGEIDILEAKNGMDSVLGSVHSGGVGALHTINGGRPAALANTWHYYALEWSTQRMRWFLDGQPYLTAYSANGTFSDAGWYSLAPGAGPHAPFDRRFHLLLNLAVGGNFPWVPPEAVNATLSTSPRRMLVDWVRVWGRPPLPRRRQAATAGS